MKYRRREIKVRGLSLRASIREAIGLPPVEEHLGRLIQQHASHKMLQLDSRDLDVRIARLQKYQTFNLREVLIEDYHRDLRVDSVDEHMEGSADVVQMHVIGVE